MAKRVQHNAFNDALSGLSAGKRLWFYYKFPESRTVVSAKVDVDIITEEYVKEQANVKTTDSFKRWEQSQEYSNLVYLFIQTRQSHDIVEIYQNVRENAIAGDTQAINTYLKLTKEINELVRETGKQLEDGYDYLTDEFDDGLEL